MNAWLRTFKVGRKTVTSDALTGFVMAIITIPGDLANGVLAGVNPVYALYSLIAGTAVAGLFTSTVLMNVDSTSATSLATYEVVRNAPPESQVDYLVVLALLAGLFQLAFGLLKLGFLVRFISNAVMTGFLTGIAALTILGQVGDLTGYASDAGNKVFRAIDTLLHPGAYNLPTFVIGVATIAIILLLDRTRLSRYSFLIGIGATTLVTLRFFSGEVALVGDTTIIPRSLPALLMPNFALVPQLLLPALAIAIVALVQAAGVSQGYPNPDGSPADPSGDFRGQGLANVATGLVGGITVGGSLGNTALLIGCGAQSRWANIFTALFAALGVLLLSPVIELLPMPGLAGLLVVVGLGMINRSRIWTTWRTGIVPGVTMIVVFIATLFLPIQWAVFLGVAMTFTMFVYNSADSVRVEALVVDEEGDLTEIPVPERLEVGQVLVLQPVGSLFFAGAAALETALPGFDGTHGAAIVLRLREYDEIGSTFARALSAYATKAQRSGNRLYLAGVEPGVMEQLTRLGITEQLGAESIFPATPKREDAVFRAVQAAQMWVLAAGKEEMADSAVVSASDGR